MQHADNFSPAFLHCRGPVPSAAFPFLMNWRAKFDEDGIGEKVICEAGTSFFFWSASNATKCLDKISRYNFQDRRAF